MIRLCAFSDEADDGLRGQIAALRRNGIALCELRSVDGKNVSTFSRQEAKEIRRALNGEGISVWSVGSPLGKCDITVSEQAWAEQVKTVCEIANALGADKIRAFSFFHAYGARDRVLDLLHKAAEIASDFSVTLYHENEKDIFGDSVARVADLMQSLPDWQFIYDPANFLQVGERADDSLKLAPRCGYYHIKDVVAKTGELVPAGEGDGAIARLLATVRQDTVLTVEPHLAVFGAYAQIDTEPMRLKYRFESNTQAFDTAVNAVKTLLQQCGYESVNGGYTQRGSRD